MGKFNPSISKRGRRSSEVRRKPTSKRGTEEGVVAAFDQPVDEEEGANEGETGKVWNSKVSV